MYLLCFLIVGILVAKMVPLQPWQGRVSSDPHFTSEVPLVDKLAALCGGLHLLVQFFVSEINVWNLGGVFLS